MKKKIVMRPWGKFEQFCENEKCTVKVHYLKPNQEFSLQYHNKRDEFWKILEGDARVTIENKTYSAKSGNEFFIKRKQKHRLQAKGEPLKVLEICFGSFDENDEVRFVDKYGRKSPRS